jgi:DNA-binding NarL/FixJ family response regulator
MIGIQNGAVKIGPPIRITSRSSLSFWVMNTSEDAMNTKDLQQKHAQVLRLIRDGEDPERVAEVVGWPVSTIRTLMRSESFAAQSSGK